ncbi:MAG: hypothetical protein ACD_58C00029G0001 [uncultured bacterium]|nr:MAG: hypothetical protein ACD_58C00029G0001 [uncultured bacterium]
MTRGNNRHRVFEKPEDYEYYLDLIKRFKTELPFDLYHYSLMPNHVHQLIQTRKAEDFSLYMKKINLAYFHHYKRVYDWVGHFWQGRFKSKPVGKDEYFIQCGKYIELNCVRSNLVQNPLDYKFSSYRYYALGEKNDLITRDIFYNKLGKSELKRQGQYQKIVVNDIIINSYSKNIWGSRDERYNEGRKIKYHS